MPQKYSASELSTIIESILVQHSSALSKEQIKGLLIILEHFKIGKDKTPIDKNKIFQLIIEIFKTIGIYSHLISLNLFTTNEYRIFHKRIT